MKTFGENLKYYRVLANLSQKKLGYLLGFSARTVSDWECDNSEPNINCLKKLIKILNMTYEELLNYEN